MPPQWVYAQKILDHFKGCPYLGQMSPLWVYGWIYTYVRKVFHHLEQNGFATASILIRPMTRDSLEPYLIILNALFWQEKYLTPSFDKCRKYRVWILALKYENCIKVNNAKNTRTFQRRKISHKVSKGKWTIISQNWRPAELSSFYCA